MIYHGLFLISVWISIIPITFQVPQGYEKYVTTLYCQRMQNKIFRLDEFVLGTMWSLLLTFISASLMEERCWEGWTVSLTTPSVIVLEPLQESRPIYLIPDTIVSLFVYVPVEVERDRMLLCMFFPIQIFIPSIPLFFILKKIV